MERSKSPAKKGRPFTKDMKSIGQQVFELSLLGATDAQIAKCLDVPLPTFNYWKQTQDWFREALDLGKMRANAKVTAALYKKACGFSYNEEHYGVFQGKPVVTKVTKYVPPDAWAAAKWLSLRAREEGWADIQKTETVQTNINIMKLDLTGFSTEELMLIKKLKLSQLTENVSPQ